MNWYYATNGHQKGPLPTEDLKSRIAMGEVSPTDLAWREGMADWMPVGSIPELKVEAAPARVDMLPSPGASQDPESAPTPQPYTPPASPAAPAPGYSPMPGQQPSQGLAIASMICGILSLVGCCIWPVAGVLALVAIVLGHISVSRANSEPQRFGGKGMAKGGLVTGYLGLLAVVTILGVSMWMATLSPQEFEDKVIKILPPEMQEQMRDQFEEQRKLREK
jgi:uncharacterized membrane protein YphA (DoxX/SURF4 family)